MERQTTTKSTTAKKAPGRTVAKKQAAVAGAKLQARARSESKDRTPKEVTSASDWKKDSDGIDLEVPSGKVALVRMVGIEAFLTEGLIPNSLRDVAMEAISKKKSVELKVEDFSMAQLNEMLELFNSVTVYCVLKPSVRPVPHYTQENVEKGECAEGDIGNVIPIGHELRRDDVLYVDEVDLADKAYIFQYACGGPRDLESFRAQFAGRMELLSGQQDVGD